MATIAAVTAAAAGIVPAPVATPRAALAQGFTSKAPTAADWAALAKLPDLNGVWERGAAPAPARGAGANAARGAGANAARGAGANAPAPAAGRGNAPGGAAPPAARGGGGGRGRAGGPAFTPKYEALRAAAAAQPAPEDVATANCVPPAMPGIMGQPYPMEFLLTPGKVTIVIEAYTQVRHIYTDGRPLPAEPDPKFYGTSIGRWEGDTLVAETVGFGEHVQLARGVGHGDAMKIVERFRLTDPDTMTIETTITDPEVLTEPYVTRATLRRHRDWTISEYICQENNRNFVDPSGKSGVNLKE
jgi:hypothetical protein